MPIDLTLYDQPAIAARFRGAFPASLIDDVNDTLHLLPAATSAPSAGNIGPITIQKESIHIPDSINHQVIADFAAENLPFVHLTQQQVISYWDIKPVQRLREFAPPDIMQPMN